MIRHSRDTGGQPPCQGQGTLTGAEGGHLACEEGLKVESPVAAAQVFTGPVTEAGVRRGRADPVVVLTRWPEDSTGCPCLETYEEDVGSHTL